MKCDIIIPIWNQLDYTRDCIEGILKNTAYPYRLILIDNASDDEMRRYLDGVKAKRPRDVELIRNEENLGFVKAVNQGLKCSKEPYVCVLNNDTIPATSWLERLIDFAESHKDVGLVKPQCDGHLDRPIEIYARMLETNKGRYMEMNQCQGFCMLVKREVIERIGYLDESFGIGGFDDTDYSMRAHRAGYRSVAIYDAYVYHRLHASFNRAGNREEWVKRNEKIYYDKWGKHLRVGIAIYLDVLDAAVASSAILLAYGLAREWSWVHMWIDFRGDKDILKKTIESFKEKNRIPPHQNIKVGYFNMPKGLFDLVIAGKLLERLKPRMRDKRFDAIIRLDDSLLAFTFSFAKALKARLVTLSSSRTVCDWEKEGRELAAIIKETRHIT